MKITEEWLIEKRACGSGYEWFVRQEETDGVKVVEKLIAENRLDWANWLIVRLMDYKQYASYAVFAAEQVIDIFERKYPEDKRPRQAIEAAKRCIKDPSDANKKAAYAAADAATAACAAARADAYARAAADAAAYAAAAARAAAYAAAAAAAYARADAATAACAAARANSYSVAMRIKILQYGLELLNK